MFGPVGHIRPVEPNPTPEKQCPVSKVRFFCRCIYIKTMGTFTMGIMSFKTKSYAHPFIKNSSSGGKLCQVASYAQCVFVLSRRDSGVQRVHLKKRGRAEDL